MLNMLVVWNRTLTCLLGLSMMSLLTGCLADSVKLSESILPELRTIRVVAVESPPLEVKPGLLESRMPVYRHYNNMVLPLCPEVTIYLNPGGILIAGKMGQDDSVEEVNFLETGDASDKDLRLQTKILPAGAWWPTLELSMEAASQLRANKIKVIPDRHILRLPLAMNERSVDLVRWCAAVEQWYGLNTASVNYQRLDTEPVDAVLEIGIGKYKIFEGQTSLQILIKLIDTNTGQVIARSSLTSRAYEASAQTLLDHEGTRFKELIREMGMQLMAQGFQKIGLFPLSVTAPSLPIRSW